MPGLHRGAQVLDQASFQVGDIRVTLDRSHRLAQDIRPLLNQGLDLTHGRPMCNNMSRPFYLSLYRQTEECTGVVHLQVTMGK